MAITVDLESLSTKSRFVTQTSLDVDGAPTATGSEYPMPIISGDMLRLKEGRIFGVGVVYDFVTPLGAGASIDIGIAWPAGVEPVVSFAGLCAGDAIGFLYEGASLSGGTALTPVKLNRASTNTSQAAVVLNPTVGSTGNLVLKQLLLGGSGKKAGGGDVGSSNLILKPLTSYLVRITNANGTAHAAEMLIEWAE